MIKRIFGKGGGHKKSVDDNKEKDQEKLEEASSEIEEKMKDLEKKQRKTISLLLLGPGGSGKSTVLKQMEKIYCGQVQNKILRDAAQYIRANILEDIHDLASQNGSLLKSHPECKLSEEAQEICDRIASLKGGQLEETTLSPDLAKHITTLWKEQGLQNTFNIRRRSHIMDNAPYFFENIDRIADPKYVTNFEDYVRVRHRTTGIIESEFEVNVENASSNQWKFKVTDVGGQRTERRKLSASLKVD